MLIINALFQGIKNYKTSIFSIDEISKVVPLLFVNGMLIIGFKYKHEYVHIFYDSTKLLTFQNSLGHAIYNSEFDSLDNIILNFFQNIQGYHAIYGNLQINFNENATLKFVEICNSFKDKQWDDIVDKFVDALCDLLATGEVHGN